MLILTEIVLGATLAGHIVLFLFLLRQQHTFTQRLFTLYIASIATWTFCIFLNLWAKSAFVEELIFASAAIGLSVPVWFASLYPEKQLVRAHIHWSMFVGAAFFAASFVKGGVFEELTVHPEGYTTLTSGFLSAPYSLFAFAFSAAPILLFWKKLRRAHDPIIRAQLRYLVMGFSAFLCVSTLTNSILPVFFHVYVFNAIGPVFSLCLATAVIYIIWRHQFLDIRIIVQRGLIYSILFALIAGAYGAILLIIGDLLNIATGVAAPISAGMVMILGVMTIPTLESFFRKATDRFFFKDRYDYSLALQELSDILNTHNTPRPLIADTLEALRRILRSESVSFHMRDTASDAPAALMIPVASKERELGVIALGEKLSGDPYTQEDRMLLRTLAAEFAIALQKAELYGRVREHSRDLEKKVAQRTAHLEELREYQKRMTSDLSHEIQTPLTIIRSALESLARTSRGADVQKQVRTVRTSTDRLSRLIYDLLHLSKLEALPTPEHHAFSLSLTASHVAEYVSVVCERQGIELTTDIKRGIRISGDRAQIEELITNLLSNAVRYMKKRGKKTITLSLRKADGMAELRVEDSGIGISADALPHIFERFYRAHQDDTPGSGLGLAICKRIVELHRGEIAVESTEKVGSTFIVRLPLE
ncbi:MAG TPA: ATP-binding protein [Candidatus Paceibacterota bacterium]